MGTGLRILICALVAVATAVVVVAFQHYAHFMEDSSYLVGGTGGIAVVLAWQLTGAKKVPR